SARRRWSGRQPGTGGGYYARGDGSYRRRGDGGGNRRLDHRVVNSGILSAPRMLQAMAADGLFFRFAANLHPRYHTPAGGIVLQAVWAIALVLSGTYGQLLDYVVFGDWIFFGLIVATVFGYRRRDVSGAARAAVGASTYRAPGYPILPALFDIIAAFVVVSVIWSSPRNAALGVV